MALSDCRNFFSANRQCQQKLACKVSGRYNQTLPRHRRANFVSRADLAGKVRHHTVPKTLSSCIGIPQGWSR